ncbi:methionyl-tRNA formyltransferase [Pseudoalteromonas arctica]|uniref:phosphoribosylglycinamide formyltransferase 1 n=1 Tax=Pseudoalteromonas arctica TaxID=394751 RepID=A0AAP6Y3Q9_9GAMM|nr:formyltransferase family protein [Pseudoalteromonas arctica]NMP03401.1 methionyl-tRNA formyltransferase [Pseudoalteromonas arctica]
MSIVFICGSHPRHAYIAKVLAETGYLKHLIIETREEHVPSPPDSLSEELKVLFNHHFRERSRVETFFFGETVWPNVPITKVTKNELDSAQVKEIIAKHATSLLISYGCHKLSTDALSNAPKHKWNCHGGLSPWYKGAITHFWPSYLLEPQMTGMTVHKLAQELDGGEIIHQCVSPLVRGDTLHKLAARAVIELSKELPQLVKLAIEKEEIPSKVNNSSGMLWRSAQWHPHHLEVIYKHFEDKIVDAYLDNKLINKEPELFRQF